MKKISPNGFGGKFCWFEFRGAPCEAKDAFGYCSVLLIFLLKLFLEAKKRERKKKKKEKKKEERLEIALGLGRDIYKCGHHDKGCVANNINGLDLIYINWSWNKIGQF